MVAPLLGCISPRGRVLSVAGDKHAAAAMHGLAVRDGRVEVRRAPLRDLPRAVAQNEQLDGAVVSLGMAALPRRAASWLDSVGPEELGQVFEAHAEQEDPLLWARLAEVMCMVRGRRPPRSLETNGDVMELVKAGIQELADPAGPPAWMAMDAIRQHLRGEEEDLAAGLRRLLGRLDLGARCAVFCARRRAALAVRRCARELEDCDPGSVAAWPSEKVPALYPLLAAGPEQDWCVREMSGSSSLGVLPLVSAYQGQAFILQKCPRRPYDWGPGGSGRPPELFREPTAEPEFAGAP